jgi:C4-dicarboxylate-binding protein DctP
MKAMEKASMLVVVLFLVALCFVGSRAILFGAEQPIDIKITTIQMRQQQMGIGIERIAKYSQEKLKDRVRMRTYPAAQLYSGREELQAIMKGEIQMAYVLASILEPLDPALEVRSLPYLFPNIDVAYKVLEGPFGKRLFSPVEQKGVALLGILWAGDVLVHNNRRPIRNPEDFKGLKMRSYGTMGAACLKALGANAIVSVPEEMYTAFQTGMIDGGANPISVFMVRKLYDVQKYVTHAGMLNVTLDYVMANKDWWNGLPADVRGGLSEVVQRVVMEQRAEIVVENRTLLDQIRAKGTSVYQLSPSELTGWTKALESVYREFSPVIGPELVKEAQQEVERLTKTKK